MLVELVVVEGFVPHVVDEVEVVLSDEDKGEVVPETVDDVDVAVELDDELVAPEVVDVVVEMAVLILGELVELQVVVGVTGLGRLVTEEVHEELNEDDVVDEFPPLQDSLDDPQAEL